MKIIIEVDDEQTFDGSFQTYVKCINVDEEYIKSIKFEK
jgi:hypothetical protein